MNLFSSSSDPNEGESNQPQSPLLRSPYLSLNPDYLSGADEYILPEDAAPVRSRAQMMFSTIGTATVLGASVGGMDSLRYGGLQWFTGKSKRMQLTSVLIKNGGQMAQRFGTVGILYCTCSIICEKTRKVEDDFNTLFGGAVAGALYMLPGILGQKKEITAETKFKMIKKLPPAGRLLFGICCGFTLSGIICLSRSQGSSIVRDVTRRT